MVRERLKGFGAGTIGFAGTLIVAVLAGAGRMAHAACTDCTFYGTNAGASVTTASYDSGFGFEALYSNITGDYNTAAGYAALYSNTMGYNNTATGLEALYSNTTGHYNTATGLEALVYNTTGDSNTAAGDVALLSNTEGSNNTATGYFALLRNTTGGGNTAAGDAALVSNTNGNDNVAVGYQAGENLTIGSNNIDIGNDGLAGESGTIRIGTENTQSAAYIAGITSATSGVEVVVNTSTGQLNYLASSARYKRDIRDMGDASTNLMKLRPVTFRYKADPNGTLQYGLIAEEVERVYPELVAHGPDGKAEAVFYQQLPAMLLNQVQKLTLEAQRKDAQITTQQRQIASLQKQLDALRQQTAQIGTLAQRLSALEQQARGAGLQHLASALR